MKPEHCAVKMSDKLASNWRTAGRKFFYRSKLVITDPNYALRIGQVLLSKDNHTWDTMVWPIPHKIGKSVGVYNTKREAMRAVDRLLEDNGWMLLNKKTELLI